MSSRVKIHHLKGKRKTVLGRPCSRQPHVNGANMLAHRPERKVLLGNWFSLDKVTSPLCTQLSAFIYWDSSKCLPQGMVLKIQEFRVNELRHGKASSIVPGIQKLFKMCWFPSSSSINDKIKAKFPRTSIPHRWHHHTTTMKYTEKDPKASVFQFYP